MNIIFRARWVLIAATISLLSGYVYNNYLTNESASAVICAPLVRVISPISGELHSNVDLSVGSTIKKGQSIMQLTNTRLDDSLLIEARHLFQEAEVLVTQTKGRLALERRIATDLSQRANKSSAAQRNVLSARLQRDEFSTQENLANLAAARMEAARVESLYQAGFVSASAREIAKTTLAERQARAESNRLDLQAKAELAKAQEKKVLLVDDYIPGVNDLDFRLITARNLVSQHELDLRTADERLAIAKNNLNDKEMLFEKLRRASINALSDGKVIQTDSVIGGEVRSGATLLTYVKCDELHVVALVSESLYKRLGKASAATADVKIGDLKLAGKVVGLAPTPFTDLSFHPAATVVLGKPGSVTGHGYVLIKLDHSKAGCNVGSPTTVSFSVP